MDRGHIHVDLQATRLAMRKPRVRKTVVTYSVGYKAIHKMVAKAKFFEIVWMVCCIYLLAELAWKYALGIEGELEVNRWMAVPCWIGMFYFAVKYSDLWAHRWLEMWASKEVNKAEGDGE